MVINLYSIFKAWPHILSSVLIIDLSAVVATLRLHLGFSAKLKISSLQDGATKWYYILQEQTQPNQT